LSLKTDDAELGQAIEEHVDTIAAETLAEGIVTESYAYSTDVKIDGAELTVSLEK